MCMVVHVPWWSIGEASRQRMAHVGRDSIESTPDMERVLLIIMIHGFLVWAPLCGVLCRDPFWSQKSGVLPQQETFTVCRPRNIYKTIIVE